MNQRLQTYAKRFIKDGLALLPDDWVMKFKRIYSPSNLDLHFNEVVDRIPDDKLDLAMTHVENSINKIIK